MTDYTAMFDTLGVKCLDTGKLFYREYPFKITINDPVSRPKFRNGFAYNSPTNQREIDTYRVARATFMRKRERTVTAAREDWRWMDNQGVKTLSYFFKRADDALHFVKKNKAHIRSIHRPENQAIVEAMLAPTDDKTVLVARDNLFWDRFRYCIQFKRTDEARDAADDFWEHHLKDHREDRDRAMYNFDHDRRLYLNDERDVFFAAMGLKAYFKDIQQVILKSEISDAHEPESGPQAD